MSLTKRVLIALIAGIIFGLALNLLGFAEADTWSSTYLINGVLTTVGQLFINALKMLVVPLVIFSLIPGIVGIGDVKLLGRVGGKTFALYLFTTALAIVTAIALSVVFDIGSGTNIIQETQFTGREAPSIVDVLTGIIPANPIKAMSDGNMLAVIFFSVVFGVCLLSVQKDAPAIINWVEQMNAVMMKMVTVVMHFAPYAVFCLIAKALSELGFALLMQLITYVLTLLGALMLHAAVSLMVMLRLTTGLNPFIFLRKVRAAQIFAFSTASSAATIPVTLQAVQEKIGVNRSVASFTVPFGANVNMDGTAIMQGVATVFIANLYGIELGLIQYLTVVLMALLASIGTAAVPSVGLVMLTMVFNQTGLPIEGIGLLLGVDRLLDMARTAVNVTCDAVVSTIVAKSEGQLDQECFYNAHAGVIDE